MSEIMDEGRIESVFSDRLWAWDPEKFDNCCLKIWGNTKKGFRNRSMADIERFLELYLGESIVLLDVISCENAFNGYPYWRFDYWRVK